MHLRSEQDDIPHPRARPAGGRRRASPILVRPRTLAEIPYIASAGLAVAWPPMHRKRTVRTVSIAEVDCAACPSAGRCWGELRLPIEGLRGRRAAVLERDWNRLLELGAVVYALAKLAFTDGRSYQYMASQMTGMSETEYVDMMLKGGRSPDGWRSKSEREKH